MEHRIYRWQIEPDSPMDIVIPLDTPIVEALELGPSGLTMKRMVLSPDGSSTTFPELEIWDDPSRSPVLARSEEGWQDEDTTELLRAWEEERLGQFQEHCFRHYYSMQVAYRMPPTAEPVHFHKDGVLYQGWRVGMIASFFAGFKPRGLTLYNPGADEPVVEPEPPRLRLIE